MANKEDMENIIKNFEQTTAKISEENDKILKAIATHKQELIDTIEINDKNHYDRFSEVRGCINKSETKGLEAVQRIENNLRRLLDIEKNIEECKKQLEENVNELKTLNNTKVNDHAYKEYKELIQNQIKIMRADVGSNANRIKEIDNYL